MSDNSAPHPFLIIHITGNLDTADGGRIPPTFGLLAGVLFPIDAPEVHAPGASHVTMSRPIFNSFYGRHCAINRLGLDLRPLPL